MSYCAVNLAIVTEKLSVSISTNSSILLIVDSQVQDYLYLLSGVQSGVQIAVVDAHQDGVKQITEILQQGYGWRQVHLISHGSPGCLHLGNTELSLATIAEYKFALHKWSKCFQPGGELFIYGCQVAAGNAGEEFLSQLHHILKVEIAASRTLTGNSALGGNWHLEASTSPNQSYWIEVDARTRGDGDAENLNLAKLPCHSVRTGAVNPIAIFQPHVLANYQGILGTFVVNSIADTDDGDLGNGITTLREAVNAANSDKNTAHLITFDFETYPQTIFLNSSLGVFGNITIDGGDAADITLDGGNNNRHFYVSQLQELSLQNLTLINGKDQAGGSIFTDENARLNISRVTFQNNEAVIDGSGGSGVGGAIFSQGILRLTDTTFQTNKAAALGGAIYNAGKPLTATRTLFADNQAGGAVNSPSFVAGGAIFDDRGNIELIQSTFSGNRSTGDGGAVFNKGKLSVYSSTLTLNVADSDNSGSGRGGGFFNDGGTIRVSNSIIAGNEAAENADVARASSYSGLYISLGGNLIGEDTVKQFKEYTDITFIGAGISDISQVLDTTLALNGAPLGSPLSHGLVANSLAIDGGLPSWVNLPTDATGQPRVQNLSIDIGAVEFTDTSGTPIAAVNDDASIIIDTGSSFLTALNSESQLGADVAYQGNGQIVYTLDPDFQTLAVGETAIDTITYADIEGVKTLKVQVTGVNQAPVGVNDVISTVLTFNPLVNDTDIDSSDRLRITSITSPATNGQVIINNPDTPDSTITYTPDAGFTGSDTFTYALSDGNGGTSTAQVTVNVGTSNLVIVTTNQDIVDAGDGVTSLREAIATLNGLGSGTIGFDLPGEQTIALTQGQLDILPSSNITIQGTGADALTISGNQQSRLFFVDVDAQLTLNGLTLADGIDRANNSTFPGVSQGGAIRNHGTLIINDSVLRDNRSETIGGAIVNGSSAGDMGELPVYNASLTINNTRFINNTTKDQGGAIYNGFTGNGGTVSINNSSFEQNRAQAIAGAVFNNNGGLTISNTNFGYNFGGDQAGAIYNNGGTNPSAILTVTDGTFVQNLADREGGAIFNTGTASLTRNKFLYNRADNAGGAVFNANSTANLTVTDSQFSYNLAVADRLAIAGVGGAIANSDGSLTLTRSILDHNYSQKEGGGLFTTGTAAINVSQSSIHDNIAYEQGGGIASNGSSDSVVNIANSTISRNQAANNGGGIVLNSGKLNLDSVTVALNVGNGDGDFRGFGGGIYTNSSYDSTPKVTVRNSIIAGNIDYSGIAPDIGQSNFTSTTSSFKSLGNNLIGTDRRATTNGFFLDASDRTFASASITDITQVLNPNLSGDDIPTHQLVNGSIALDNGNTTLTTDQRGKNRTGTADIGAYEVQPDDTIPLAGTQLNSYFLPPVSTSDTIITKLTVNSTADTDDNNINNGVTTLREAINYANRTVGDVEINFDLDSGSHTITLGSELVISSNIQILGSPLDDITIDGNGTTRLLRIDSNFNEPEVAAVPNRPLPSVILQNLTLANGLADQGGAINNAGNLFINGVKFRNNQATSGGGAIYHRRNDGNPLLGVINSEFSNNTAADQGGAILLEAIASIQTSTFTKNTANQKGGAIAVTDGQRYDAYPYSLELADNYFSENTGINGGGALYVTNNARVNALNSNFEKNASTAGDGGAVLLDGYNTTLITKDSRFAENTAKGTGGGIASQSGVLSLANTTVDSNTADGSGGGIHQQGSGSLTLTSTTISKNNSGDQGGGVYTDNILSRVVNTTFSANQAKNSGGGIFQKSTKLTLTNSTLVLNVADSDADGTGVGGGIFNDYSTAKIANTIIAGNQGNSAPDVGETLLDGGYGASIYISRGNNFVGVDSVGEFKEATDQTFDSTGLTNINQLLDPTLAENGVAGGSRLTHALLANSPLVDAGNNAFAPMVAKDEGGIDATGQPRIINSVVDIGATEFQGSVGVFLATTTTDEAVTFNSGSTTVEASSPITTKLGGTVINHGTGFFTYKPAENLSDLASNQNALDSFTYNDADGLQTANILVNGIVDTSTGFTVPDLVGSNVLLVTTTEDGIDFTDGQLSLREAVQIATSEAGDWVIGFNLDITSSQTITLTEGQLLVGHKLPNNIKIVGTGAKNLTISGNNASRIFYVERGSTLELSGLTIADGMDGIEQSISGSISVDQGAAIRNQGNLIINDAVFRDNYSKTIGGAILNAANPGSSLANPGASSNYQATLTVNNTTFINNFAKDQGGAIYNGFSNGQEGLVTITNSRFIRNVAGAIGGAIFNNAGALTVSDSTFTENDGGGQAGAIYNNGNSNSSATATITDTEFIRNLAEREGGALFITGNTTITNGTFTSNRADTAGGAIYAASNANLTITDSKLTKNIALADRSDKSAGIGGAIALAQATLNMQGTTLSDNTAQDEGGGIFSTDSTLNITGSTISTNTAGDDGGGLSNNYGTVNLTNSTISGNIANDNGGGIFQSSGLTQLLNTTVTLNMANVDGEPDGMGGGIYNKPSASSEVRLQNSIVAGNYDFSGLAPDINPGIDGVAVVYTSQGHNFIGVDSPGAFTATGDQTFTSAGISEIEQVLNPVLENNGGQTLTHALVKDSPALNTGANPPVAGITTDQRLALRIAGETVDIGSYEALVLDAINDKASTQENTPVVIDVLSNDISINGIPTIDSFQASSALGGMVTQNDDNSFTYTAPQSIIPNDVVKDTFTYTLSDGTNTDEATVTVEVTGESNPPAPVADEVTVAANQSTQIQVKELLKNDQDLDLSGLSLTLEDLPTYGSVILNDNDTLDDLEDDFITYNPNQNFEGDDVFSYKLVDKFGFKSAKANVNLRIVASKIVHEDNNLFSVIGVDKVKVKFTVSQIKTNQVNEIGVFVVDDAEGRVNGLLPGSPGYLQAALNPNRPQPARVIFSTLSHNLFPQFNSEQLLSFNAGDRLQFYLVQDSTTDLVIAGKSDRVLLGSAVNANGEFTTLTTEEFNDGNLTIRWQDQFNNSLSFDSLEINLQVTNEDAPIGTNLQGLFQSEVIDLREFDGQVLTAQFTVWREASLNNVAGLYVVENAQGSVRDEFGVLVNPGDARYIEVAMQRRVTDLELKVNNQSHTVTNVQIEGGDILAPFLIIDGTINQLIDDNASNNPSIYFPYLGANTDGFDHLRLLGSNHFGFEDLPGGGDGDYNDIVFKVDLSPVV
ncbi:MAG: DUF4347 domain-containing protein [Desmonostoc vinosum HA7617-LM4]|jgi:CSLREA domain-containing protein|nr:DUF4347 domain-containing protein [Desmonostoc vinosum HA7617-LM4]